MKNHEQLISLKVPSDTAAYTCAKLLHNIGTNYVQNFVHAEPVDVEWTRYGAGSTGNAATATLQRKLRMQREH